MAFINDYLTEEEKAKFEEYNVMYPPESDYAHYKVGTIRNSIGGVLCTIDREREMYLFQAVNSLERREFIRSIDYFTLVIVREDVVSVAYFHLNDKKVNQNYHMYWQMCGIDMDLVKGINRQEVIDYLKEALRVYGISGKKGRSTARIGFDF